MAIGLLVTSASVSAAWGDGEGETTEGYLLVQQALGHLAHDPGMSGMEAANEKVNDALTTKDQEGVDVAELRRGKAALEAGNVVRARSLLQDSIQEALGALPPATGNQTGTRQIPPELPGRTGLHAQDWMLIAASVLALVLGVWLSVLFRPDETIRTLRARLAPTLPSGSGDGGKGA